MKTLQEHLKESFDNNIKRKHGVDIDFKEVEMGNGYNWIYEAMKAAISEACREQREICAAHYEYFTEALHDEEVKKRIKNAPEPNMI